MSTASGTGLIWALSSPSTDAGGGHWATGPAGLSECGTRTLVILWLGPYPAGNHLCEGTSGLWSRASSCHGGMRGADPEVPTHFYGHTELWPRDRMT